MNRLILAVLGIVLAGFLLWRGFTASRDFQSNPSPSSSSEKAAETVNTTGMPLNLPSGFSISIYAQGLDSPRVITRDPLGNILVSEMGAGRVVALPDSDSNGEADRVIDVISNLNNPHGLITRCQDESCQLFVAETDAVMAYDYDNNILKAINGRKIIDLPSGGGHFTRTLLYYPQEGREDLFVSVGSSCNVCNESDSRRAKISVANPDGTAFREYAKGLRNAVFMAIQPVTGKIWVTEMGRDWLGDNTPPDEVNIIEEGRDYGWPNCYGKQVHDNNFDSSRSRSCGGTIPSHIDIQAHSAPLGLAFFPEEGWPEEYWHDLLVAYHGSWNRSSPTGYKIVRYFLDEQGRIEGSEDFITGWLTNTGSVLGRPVDIRIEPGGEIYVTDDKAGVVYRLTLNR